MFFLFVPILSVFLFFLIVSLVFVLEKLSSDLPLVFEAVRASQESQLNGSVAGALKGTPQSTKRRSASQVSTPEPALPAKSSIKTNGKWAWEEGKSPPEDSELVPEDWCCIDKSPIQNDRSRVFNGGGEVFPRYVDFGEPNHMSLYQRDFPRHKLPSKIKQPDTNPWTTFNTQSNFKSCFQFQAPKTKQTSCKSLRMVSKTASDFFGCHRRCPQTDLAKTEIFNLPWGGRCS